MSEPPAVEARRFSAEQGSPGGHTVWATPEARSSAAARAGLARLATEDASQRVERVGRMRTARAATAAMAVWSVGQVAGNRAMAGLLHPSSAGDGRPRRDRAASATSTRMDDGGPAFARVRHAVRLRRAVVPQATLLRSLSEEAPSESSSMVETAAGAESGPVRSAATERAPAPSPGVSALSETTHSTDSGLVGGVTGAAPGDPWGDVLPMLAALSPEDRVWALELAGELVRGGGSPELRRAVGLPVTTLFLGCSPVQCPPDAEEEPAVYPVWRQAELCIQTQYRKTHRGNTIGTNRDWMNQQGKDPAERQALACLRPNFTAKSGTHPGEPDLWDFSNRTMYEITTESGADFRKGKLAAEVELANKLTATADCGGTVYSPGDWKPENPCLYIGEGLVAEVRNESGVLIYRALRSSGKGRRIPVEMIVLLIWLLKIWASGPKPTGPLVGPGTRPAGPILLMSRRMLDCLRDPDFFGCVTGDRPGA